MKNKKFLTPININLIFSFLLVIYAFFAANFPETKKPLALFEKLGIYSSGMNYGITKTGFSLNGTHEAYVSALKATAVNSAFTVIVSFAVLALLLIVSLVIITSLASETEYKWTAYLCAILLPIAACDFTNLAFFKTVFANPLIIVLMSLMCAMFMLIYRAKIPKISGILLVSLVVFLYSRLGTVQAITAVVAGIIIIKLYRICENKIQKILAIGLGSVIIIQSIFFVFTYKPVDYKQNIYNAVFFGIAKYDSVTELGLSPELDDFKEIYYGMKDDEQEYDLDNSFYNKISYMDITKYYITHPINAYKVINYQTSLYSLHEQSYGFSPYNFIKTRLPVNFLVAIIITLAYVLISNAVGKKYCNIKHISAFFSSLSVMWLLSLITGALYYGNSDMAINMTTSSVLFDIVVLSALIGGIRIVIKGQDEKRAQYGITHE